jgi:hypothetical protein
MTEALMISIGAPPLAHHPIKVDRFKSRLRLWLEDCGQRKRIFKRANANDVRPMATNTG